MTTAVGFNPLGMSSPPTDPRVIFVVHGRDERLRKAMFDFLRALGLKPLEWSEAVSLTGVASPYVGHVLDVAFAHAQAVVVLMTPDDEVRLREDLQHEDDAHHERELTGQARPNVLFEAGMALARHPERTLLVEVGKLRPFSDIGGRHLVRLDNGLPNRQEVANRLRTAGCPVNITGTDWHTTGDFTPPSPKVVDVIDALRHPHWPLCSPPRPRSTRRPRAFLAAWFVGVTMPRSSGTRCDATSTPVARASIQVGRKVFPPPLVGTSSEHLFPSNQRSDICQFSNCT